MNLAETMDDLSEALATVSGLRFYAWPNFAATPPCGIVGYPDQIDYDLTFQANTGHSSGDHAIFKVWLVVGDQVTRTARDSISKYVSSDDAKSIKLAVESHVDFTCQVKDCKIVNVNMGGNDYLAAEFQIEVWG